MHRQGAAGVRHQSIGDDPRRKRGGRGAIRGRDSEVSAGRQVYRADTHPQGIHRIGRSVGAESVYLQVVPGSDHVAAREHFDAWAEHGGGRDGAGQRDVGRSDDLNVAVEIKPGPSPRIGAGYTDHINGAIGRGDVSGKLYPIISQRFPGEIDVTRRRRERTGQRDVIFAGRKAARDGIDRDRIRAGVGPGTERSADEHPVQSGLSIRRGIGELDVAAGRRATGPGRAAVGVIQQDIAGHGKGADRQGRTR